jgi:hypothetical protein
MKYIVSLISIRNLIYLLRFIWVELLLHIDPYINNQKVFYSDQAVVNHMTVFLKAQYTPSLCHVENLDPLLMNVLSISIIPHSFRFCHCSMRSLHPHRLLIFVCNIMRSSRVQCISTRHDLSVHLFCVTLITFFGYISFSYFVSYAFDSVSYPNLSHFAFGESRTYT